MDRGTRTTLLVTAAELLPLPVVDTLVQNRLRDRYVRKEADRTGVVLSNEDLRALTHEPLIDLGRLLSWPVRALLKKVFLPLSLMRTASATQELVRRVEGWDAEEG